MSHVSTVLERVDSKVTVGAWAAQISSTVAYRSPVDDDDLIDAFLASLTVDEFEQILSGLANLR